MEVQRIGQYADTVDPNSDASAAADTLDPLSHRCDHGQVSHRQVAAVGPGYSSMWAIVGGAAADTLDPLRHCCDYGQVSH